MTFVVETSWCRKMQDLDVSEPASHNGELAHAVEAGRTAMTTCTREGQHPRPPPPPRAHPQLRPTFVSELKL